MNELLSKADLSACQKALFELAECEQILERMERCGLDVQEHRDRATHYRGVLEGVRREFGQGQGPKGQATKA